MSIIAVPIGAHRRDIIGLSIQVLWCEEESVLGVKDMKGPHTKIISNMENLVTTETIINWMKEQIENKHPIDSHRYLDAALKLNVLLQGEQEKLFTIEQEVAQLRKVLLEDGKTVSYAKSMIEASDEYKIMKTQKAKIDRAVEFIRLSKQYSRTSSDLMKYQL